MECVVIIPKRHKTFNRCLDALLQSPHRQVFQSELKRLVYSKSWRFVVKKEINYWNNVINKEFPGYQLVTIERERNPKTGKRNEYLVKLHPDIDVYDKQDHLLVKIKNEVLK